MTMGMKLGTKAFGQAPEKITGTANLPSNISATDAGKLGGENVGDVLNKLADANWVDPSKKMRTAGNDKLDKDAFFKLMLAQMKNQDPTNPLKPHEMSAQLANFSSLEQMSNINQTLTEMKAGQKPTEQFQVISLIGKAVAGDAGKVIRVKGDKDHDVNFTLPKAAAEVEVKVRNSAGDVVRTYALKNLKEGANRITWNGADDKGASMQPDEYSVFIEAKGGDGRKMAVKTDFEGIITGVNYTPEGPVMLVGNQTVRLKDLRRIVDASLMRNDQKVNDVTAQDLKKEVPSQQTQEKEAVIPSAQEPAKKASVMDNVALSREMMSKLQKETGNGG